MKFVVALIVPVAAWSPRSWDDFPASGVVLTVTERAYRRSYAEGLVFGWNAKAMDSRRWAVILPASDRIQPGESCERQVPIFRAG